MSLTLNATNAMRFVERLALLRNRPELRTPHGIALAVRTGLLGSWTPDEIRGLAEGVGLDRLLVENALKWNWRGDKPRRVPTGRAASFVRRMIATGGPDPSPPVAGRDSRRTGGSAQGVSRSHPFRLARAASIRGAARAVRSRQPADGGRTGPAELPECRRQLRGASAAGAACILRRCRAGRKPAAQGGRLRFQPTLRRVAGLRRGSAGGMQGQDSRKATSGSRGARGNESCGLRRLSRRLAGAGAVAGLGSGSPLSMRPLRVRSARPRLLSGRRRGLARSSALGG